MHSQSRVRYEHCSECGAPVPEGGSCRDSFHALLALEAQVPEAAGALPHFYAVACYALQHPEGMGYTVRALADLRIGVGEALDGRAGSRNCVHAHGGWRRAGA